MTTGTYRLGAVVYHPKVRQIWQEFGVWFGERGLPLEVHYHDTYEQQVEQLLAGQIDAAWNTNLAYVQTLDRTGGSCRGIAMRDTDRGWTSKLVALSASGVNGLEDLRGARIGFGDADSPQAQIMPVHALRKEGFDPATDCRAERLDRDVGKHGDTGGAELAQLARVRAGELDACVVSSVTLAAVGKLGDASALAEVWTSPPFHHCNFTVLEGSDAEHERFTALLAAMDASDPRLCEPMELEYVNQWVAMDETGYADLIKAVEAGPVIVG
jgi:ABC-type phosphate/phosphonate transport system substrate-binding protein